MKFKKYITESSLSRILTHINVNNFGVISSFRKENSDEKNESDYKELASIIRSMGYGFISLKGGYVGDEGFFAEKSLFVPKIKRKEIINLGKKYNQYSVIHKDKHDFVLIGTNKQAGIGKILDSFKTDGKSINIDDVGDKFKDFFSKLVKGSYRGKKFLFKMQEHVETSMYYEKKYGSKWENIYEEKQYKIITESSLSRVWSHMKEHDSGTITAFRDRKSCGYGDVYTKGQKKAMNKVLLAQLLRKGFSVTSVKGTYIENYSSSDAKEVGESVFLVVDIKDNGKLKKNLIKLGEEYEQDSILFIPKGGKEGFLIGTNHCENGYPGYGKVNKLKNPVFDDSGEFFIRVNGRPFTLKESFKNHSKPSSGMGNWAMSTIANGGWEKYYNENIEIFENEISFHNLSRFMNESSYDQKVLYNKYIKENKPELLKELIDNVVEVING